MKKFNLAIAVLAILAAAQSVSGQNPLLTQNWKAKWISVPGTSPDEYGVYYFRKDLEIKDIPESYTVHVSGDTRYKFYINGNLVSLGPARSDATHWRYETIDLAPYMKVGTNVLAATVFHEGEMNPVANSHVSSGFLLQGEGESAGLVTDKSWKCLKDEAYSPLKVTAPGYYVSGPGERVDMALKADGWNKEGFNTGSWLNAREDRAGQPKDFRGDGTSIGHNLVASPLPQLELSREYFPCQVVFKVPANSEKEILLDMGRLTNAFFTMEFSGGKGADVKIRYAEALYKDAQATKKANRNDTEGKYFIGREDEILPDGSDDCTFSTLAWRTYRFIRITVKTADEPFEINNAYGTFVGYPFKLEASLDTDNTTLQKIFETGWRTARLCAIETYMDCPYYEQLQYLGDTRIQALVSLFNSGDDRLVKNFLYMADISRSPEGITMSRYPSDIPQYIQPYALSYIYAIHDYLMYGADTDFALSLLPGAEQILNYYSKYQMEDGRLQDLPGWNFSDWVDHWKSGVAREGADRASSLMDLQLLLALRMMSEMEYFAGNNYLGSKYYNDADKLAGGIKAAYWDEDRKLFANRIEKDDFSQHAGSLAILSGLVKGKEAKEMAQRLLTDESLDQCTVYYKFYLHEALSKAGLADNYLDWLDIWKENLAMGMTTWAEDSNIETTRSDCHAWGASPNIEFFRTILGIDSAAAGFKKVKIEPHLGSLRNIGGTMPHPSGKISVSYKMEGKQLNAKIILPDGISGIFIYAGREYQLKAGENLLTVS